jgi:hypothetical protein
MISHISLSKVHSENACLLRTLAGHNYHVQEVMVDKSLAGVYGVRDSCPFSVLQHFNAIECLPPDIMHDLLEGLSLNFFLVVTNLIKQKFFTLVQLKAEIKKFQYSCHERSDKASISCIPNDLVTRNKNIHGKAKKNGRYFIFYHCS